MSMTDSRFNIGRPLINKALSPLLIIAALLIWFLVAVVPWIHEAPDLDAMVNLRESFTFYEKGLRGLLESRGGSTHPPLVYIVSYFAFSVGGARPESMYAIGFILLVVTTLVLYELLKRHDNDRQAALAAFVVGMNPMVASSYMFVMSESLIVFIFCMSLLALLRGRSFLLAICLCGFALVKQTALVFLGPFALAVFLSRQMTWTHRIARTIAVIAPACVCAGGWMIYLHYLGGRAWNSQLMSGNSGENPFAAFLTAMMDGVFSIYFRQNLANAFVLNFNWLGVIILGIAAINVLRGSHFFEHCRPKIMWICLLTSLFYSFFVFPFPTWTIPRYGLPGLYPVLVLAAFVIMRAPWSSRVLVAIGSVFLVAQFYSIDPITTAIYGRFNERNQLIYSTDYSWRGPDRAMYNFQMSLMSREQNKLIRKIFDSPSNIIIGDCHEFKISEKIWTVSSHPKYYPQFENIRYIPCMPTSDLDHPDKSQMYANKHAVLLVPIAAEKIKRLNMQSVMSVIE
jgi:4-amino-4-deoxy-L-arabinose transferase-like glycosyltransferase